MKNNFFKDFRPIDIATLSYVIMEVFVILVFMSGREGWLYMLFFYLAATGIVLLMVTFPFDEDTVSGKMVRNLYPLFLILLFYRALTPQIFLVFERPFDLVIHQFELKLLGADTAFAIQKYMDIWLNELMHFGYLSFYFLLPSVFIIYLIFRRWESMYRMTLATILVYYVSFLLYIFYPVTGPGNYLKDIYYLPIIGPFFTPAAKNFVNLTGHYGAGMPSTHCAIVVVLAWRLFKDFRKLAIPAIFLSLLICAGTVYGRFHYLTDALAGIIIGILSTGISKRWYDWFLKRKVREEAVFRIT